MTRDLTRIPAQLERLARLYGVQTSYLDMENARVECRRESILAALRAMGALVKTERDLGSAIEARLRGDWDRQVEPVAVAWEGRLPRIELRLPVAEAQGSFEWRLRLEDGIARRGKGRLEDLRTAGRQKIGRDVFVALELPVDGEVPLGYHDLEVEVAGRRLTSRIISAPRKAYAGSTAKQWGVFLPLYALKTRRGQVADLADLDELVQWASKRGAGFVGLLPLLASFLEDPFEPSPYSPVSRLFWNELYIDTGSAKTVPNGDDLVDYKAAMAAKRAVLERESNAFRSGKASDRDSLEKYLEQRPEVKDYARFRAAMERLGPNWREWPEQQRAGELRDKDYKDGVKDYYIRGQWRIDRQMRDVARKAKQAGAELYLDMPVGVHALGYDAWRYQDLFATGISVGAPPDIVTTSGQDWGFAPLDPQALRRSGYEYIRAYLQHHLSVAGMLRVDHAMGLHRLYWIPEGAGARDGVYVRYAFEEMYAVHTLESQRNQAVIAGENLGIVPPQINAGLAEHGIVKMYVMTIELRSEAKPPFRTPPKGVVASWSTHDLPPFAAFWQDSDIAERVRLGVLTEERAKVERIERQRQRAALLEYLKQRGLIEAEAGLDEIFAAILTVLAGSRSERLLVNLEDLWQEEAPQNVPGTVDEHPNWRRKARYDLDELDELPQVQSILATLQRLRPRPDTKEAKR